MQYRELIDERRRKEAQFAKLVEDNESANLALRKRRNHTRAELSKSIAIYDKELLEVANKIEVCLDSVPDTCSHTSELNSVAFVHRPPKRKL